MTKKKVKNEFNETVADRSPFKKELEKNDYINPNSVNVEVFNPEDMFGNESGQNNEMTVSKELFNPKNPKVKTELSDSEIKIVSRLYELSKKYYEPRSIMTLRQVLDEFILERMSKDRKSRTEFVEAQKEAKKGQNNGLFDRLMGGVQ